MTTRRMAAAWCAAVAVTGLTAPGRAHAGAAPAQAQQAGWSADARTLARWVAQTGDARGRPYAIVDKKAARLLLFDPQHRLVASSPALLGATRGDDTVPGVGQRAQTGEVALHERTTPAGRFQAWPGHNLDGEAVVWVDYAAAFAIHRLRPGRAHAPRRALLADPRPAGKRVSLGCVVVPVEFFERQVLPLLGRSRSVVYVLPETRSLGEVFDAG